MKKIDEKYHYLYKTTNLINNKYYYGLHSTSNMNDGYLGSGTYLRSSIRKYGKNNFKREIIKMFDNREELILAEEELITDNVVNELLCMNLKLGGDAGCLGMVTVKDKNNNMFLIDKNDPRYLSKELVGVNKGFVIVKNKNSENIRVDKNEPRYLSGELISIRTGKIIVKDKNDNRFSIDKDDPRYLSGELVGITKDKLTVKDINGNYFSIDKDDPRYLSGELVGITKGNIISEEHKNKIGKANSIKQKGKLNSQYGKCWITNGHLNKCIKKEELEQHILDGWIKGRKMNLYKKRK